MAVPTDDADVIVVGAGPAGSSTAYHLARAGATVLVVEKATFPREKVCGDGLTPRSVRPLLAMGIDTSPAAGWLRNRGLRVIGAGMRLELPWPELATFPDYGLVRRREDFDELLARHAVKAGARLLEATPVRGPLRDDSGRVVGVITRDGTRFRAPIVVAADGVSGRMALALGVHRRDDRPMGVAVRRYFHSRRTCDDWLESWLELRTSDGRHLPGYGWVFGMGDGTSNVGLGLLNTTSGSAGTDYRALLERWVAALPEDWGFVAENAVGPVRGAALPMGFNRVPHYLSGVLLVGDAGGMVNPFNGEGIAYALESGELAAETCLQALARSPGAARERALAGYATELSAQWGRYYALGRLFVRLLGQPKVMGIVTRHGLPHPALMRFLLKLLANLTDPQGGDAMDRVIGALTRLAPAG